MKERIEHLRFVNKPGKLSDSEYYTKYLGGHLKFSGKRQVVLTFEAEQLRIEELTETP